MTAFSTTIAGSQALYELTVIADDTISKATTALRTLFRRKAKSTHASTQPLLEEASSSDEHLTQIDSSPQQTPEPVVASKTLKHKRSDAVICPPEMLPIDEDPVPQPIEPFPRYSHSFDITRYMQDESHLQCPHIVVTPASVDGDPEERMRGWSEL